MAKKIIPKWFRYEALHAAYMCHGMLESYLRDHPYYKSKINPTFNKKVDSVLDDLWDVYSSLIKENEVSKKMKVKNK